ncbi:hypothetical protein COLO4_04497 [Corchorus olitorius]|uniref:Uncharacterized protein n=1 Tax=Corchorus olitorius TaxID=93759 RepID=A0A1R3KTP0_9ROSI|nr:hypothetical protein COLO4_04497 [Corchorus olitorius]
MCLLCIPSSCSACCLTISSQMWDFIPVGIRWYHLDLAKLIGKGKVGKGSSMLWIGKGKVLPLAPMIPVGFVLLHYARRKVVPSEYVLLHFADWVVLNSPLPHSPLVQFPFFEHLVHYFPLLLLYYYLMRFLLLSVLQGSSSS